MGVGKAYAPLAPAPLPGVRRGAQPRAAPNRPFPRSQMSQPTIYTIGHSNVLCDHLRDHLTRHEIEVVADVRSSPFSRYVPHFNADVLAAYFKRLGVAYVPMGAQLGGRPDDERFLDDDGHVRYDLLADSEPFREGIARLRKGMRERKISLMCSEEDPQICHRSLLVGRVLRQHGVQVLHMRHDGRLQDDRDLLANDGQRDLFGHTEAWRSPNPARTPSFPSEALPNIPPFPSGPPLPRTPTTRPEHVR